jgi:hypothetical protein
MLYIKTHEKFCKSRSKSKNKNNVFCFPKRKKKFVHMIPKYGYVNAIVRTTSETADQAEQPTRKFWCDSFDLMICNSILQRTSRWRANWINRLSFVAFIIIKFQRI